MSPPAPASPTPPSPHVVNNSRPVSPGVREKVEAAIAELGYVPSGVARSLRSRATGTFGVLVPNAVNPYFAELARGIEDHCERQGYSVILCNSDDDADKQLRYLRVLKERRIDGLVVATVDGDPRFARALAGLRIPLVLADRPLDGVQAAHIRIDHHQGGLLATRHLLDLGHRRIACIGGPADSPVASERITGYQQAWRRPVSPLAPSSAAPSPPPPAMLRPANCWPGRSAPPRSSPATTPSPWACCAPPPNGPERPPASCP